MAPRGVRDFEKISYNPESDRQREGGTGRERALLVRSSRLEHTSLEYSGARCTSSPVYRISSAASTEMQSVDHRSLSNIPVRVAHRPIPRNHLRRSRHRRRQRGDGGLGQHTNVCAYRTDMQVAHFSDDFERPTAMGMHGVSYVWSAECCPRTKCFFARN